MLIYLDLNVILDLKKDDGARLLSFIKSDQDRNIYCFSEAHLHDLSRDQTDEKYSDMDLIAQVAGEHCFSFDGEVKFQYETPREYFDRFEWNPTLQLLSEGSSGINLMTEVFKLIPLSFRQGIGDNPLPDDMPDQFKTILDQTTNFNEFINLFYGFTKELNEQQKSFKALLQYLHQHNYVTNPLYALGIEGFNGTEITDRDTFFSSYSTFCIKNMPNSNIYEAFVRMYYVLEYLGIVKGKPGKQKMLNLANDGKHAFFGGYCDIVVSKDEDFLTKASFMYETTGIYPQLMSAKEFYEWVEAGPRPDDNMAGITGELLRLNELSYINQHEKDNTKYTTYSLSKIYFEHFNILTIGDISGEYFFYFSAEKRRFNKGTLVLQIKLLTDLLLADLGQDLQEKGAFYIDEMTDNSWLGRAWRYSDYIVELILNDGLHLTFNCIPDIPHAET